MSDTREVLRGLIEENLPLAMELLAIEMESLTLDMQFCMEHTEDFMLTMLEASAALQEALSLADESDESVGTAPD